MEKPKKKKNYLNNVDILEQLNLSHEQGKVTDTLGQMFLTLVKRFQSKASWYNYPKQVKDELTSNALCDLMDAWYKFDNTKSQNPFAYFTAVVSNSFRKTMNKEKAYLNLKTFLYQSSEETNLASYSHYMTKHHGINRFVNDPDIKENDENE